VVPYAIHRHIWRHEEKMSTPCTRKNTQILTNLQQTCSNAIPTTCQQDVFALLVPSLLTSCQALSNIFLL
jgi:hypothetical protein